MSQTYYAILTAVGEAKLANATALGTQLQISKMAVGDGNGNLPTPIRSQTALVNERYRAFLNRLIVDPQNNSQIIAELIIPETEGGYWLREMGLYDAAGDLVAVSNCPPSYKPQMSEGSGRTQVLRMVLIISSSEAVQLKIDPSVVLATREYVDTARAGAEQYTRDQLAGHLQAADPHPQYLLKGGVFTFAVDSVLTAQHTGLILLDAAAGARTYTLPSSNPALGIRDYLVRRIDNSGNRLKVAASGTDTIKFHTHLRAAGYPFLVLMGAGDWWHLRSDGQGGWWPVGRLDSTSLGRMVFETTTAFQPGGYGPISGPVQQRADFPWLWDHAQASGMLTTEAARLGKEGGWTEGDGVMTFRAPENRAEFVRLLDEGRGIDTGRVAGSSQGDAIRNITGSISAVYRSTTRLSSGAMAITQYGSSPARIGTEGADPGDNSTITFNASTVVPTASENRPRSIAYPGRIKLI
ncbi:phage tail protein [Pseudomonas entomophila]|uniref:phage tail protein n=1 Tax=Pseudomonas entomophila TaxID=312306 RepID=UPI0023D886F3|nr:phage tail protein [Pseudomonas entomophila]MDF0732327.1 phage tail protein [Pseudomonas entomophila]